MHLPASCGPSSTDQRSYSTSDSKRLHRGWRISQQPSRRRILQVQRPRRVTPLSVHPRHQRNPLRRPRPHQNQTLPALLHMTSVSSMANSRHSPLLLLPWALQISRSRLVQWLAQLCHYADPRSPMQVEHVSNLFKLSRTVVHCAAESQKPSDIDFGTLLKPFSKEFDGINNLKDKNRNRDWSNHFASVAEGIGCIGWLQWVRNQIQSLLTPSLTVIFIAICTRSVCIGQEAGRKLLHESYRPRIQGEVSVFIMV